jgi:flagellin
MSFVINTNTTAGSSLISLSRNLYDMYRSAERLSSGLRINRASDDPAGLVISEQMRSQIASLGQEIDNISAGISKYQTVSGTVGGLRGKLTELRSLAIAASNEGFNSPESQEAYQMAAEDIVESYNYTVRNAEYNGSKTLDGSEHALADLGELAGIDLSSGDSAEASIEKIDEAIAEVDAAQIELGATQKNDLEHHRASLEIERQNLISAESQIRDVDFAMEYASFVGSLIRTQAAVAMVAHATLTGASVVNLFDL